MKITGIICEYNPLHLGHMKQIDLIRNTYGADEGIVCLMSGNFVQRGMPAIVDKMRRAEAALLCGADLVLELPVTYALSSAEGFAAGGVSILSGFCDRLCFGAENADPDLLERTARALQSEDFSILLKAELEKGVSFPSARQAALETMGLDSTLLKSPNNILAVEYCKAIFSQESSMQPFVISREGRYHDTEPDSENPSATALRQRMLSGADWQRYIPNEAVSCFEDAALHTMDAGERAVLAKLRCMSDGEFEALPYGSEGLWRKFMHAARKEATLNDIISAVKSKRYTRTRLDRMLLCAFLGITRDDIASPAPYTRVLGFNDRGREILKTARTSGDFPNIGQNIEHPYQLLENRCGAMYGLFSHSIPDAPNTESQLRIIYKA